MVRCKYGDNHIKEALRTTLLFFSHKIPPQNPERLLPVFIFEMEKPFDFYFKKLYNKMIKTSRRVYDSNSKG